MQEIRKPLVPMDFSLRRRGVYLGASGMVVLFGSALGILFTPLEYLVYLLVPLVLGFTLLVAGFVTLRKAERTALEHGLNPRKKV